MKLIACISGGLLLLVAVILAAKASPLAVAAALVRGAFGSKDSVANTLIQTTPLLLTGLGVGLAFKGKLFNIGAEGQFLLGAVFAIWAGTQKLTTPVLLPLALLAGALGGAIASVGVSRDREDAALSAAPGEIRDPGRLADAS